MFVDKAAEKPRTLKLSSVAVHRASPPMTGMRERFTNNPGQWEGREGKRNRMDLKQLAARTFEYGLSQPIQQRSETGRAWLTHVSRASLFWGCVCCDTRVLKCTGGSVQETEQEAKLQDALGHGIPRALEEDQTIKFTPSTPETATKGLREAS